MGTRARQSRRLKRLETVCWIVAIVLLMPMAGATAVRWTLQVAPQAHVTSDIPADWMGRVRLDLFDESRRNLRARFLERLDADPIGRLHLPDQNAVIPVFSGSSDVAMTIGAGHLPETAPLHGAGNVVLSAHRDGPFRVLKDLHAGEEILLETRNPQSVRRFVVRDAEVVGPKDVHVLDDRAETTLTLITCFPFYFLGSAPERFVLRAVLQSADQDNFNPDTE